jgi:hypothetical protein
MPYIPKKQNAAGRLWHALNNANKLQGGQTHAQLSKTFELEGEKSDSIGIVRALIVAVESLDEIEAQIKRIPGEDYDLFLHSFPNIKHALTAAIQNHDFNQWKAGNLNHDILKPLIYCANLLSKHYGEEEITKEELNKLLHRIEEIHKSVTASSLNLSLKDRILENLEDIRNAIQEYQIRGIHALKRSLSTATGDYWFHKAEFDAAAQGKDKGEIESYGKLLGSLLLIITMATKHRLALPDSFPFTLDDGAGERA